MLRARGFRTGAAVGAAVLERRYGLDQGFDVYDDRLADGAEVVARLASSRSGVADTR